MLNKGINETAKYFLDCYARHAKVDGGLAYGTALQQARLDYTPESLVRLNALLDQVRERAKPERGKFLSAQGGVNFCYMLAFYLGRYIEKSSGIPVSWYRYEDAARVLPSDFGLPDDFFSQIFGSVGGDLFLPLGWIGDKLFEHYTLPSCTEYVATHIDKASSYERLTDNDRSEDYLSRFFSGRAIGGGLAFQAQLKDIRLDYTVESLSRIDVLLDELRSTHRLDYGSFVNDPEKANFLLLLAYYIGNTLSRVGGMPLKWAGFEETKANFPTIEHQFETKTCCILANRTFFPLGVLTERLFAPRPERTVHGYGKKILDDNGTRLPQIIARPSPSTAPESEEPPTTWDNAMRAAGAFAAFGMFLVSDGAALIPTLLEPGSDGKQTFVKLVSDTAEEALKRGDTAMRDNDKGLPYLAFQYEAYLNLPSGRTDALVIELRCYDSPALTLKLGFPFRTASHPEDFAILDPFLIECSAPISVRKVLIRSLYAGIDAWKAGPFSWQAHELGTVKARNPKVDESRPATGATTTSDGVPHERPSQATPEDYAEMVAQLRAKASAGSAEAQRQLAMCYQDGIGVDQDHSSCVYWYTQAATQGDAIAINNLADKYEHGFGVEQDLNRALALYWQAADLNIVAAWYSLGGMYRDGRGVPKDTDKALEWMKRAARHDFLDARNQEIALLRERSSAFMAEGQQLLQQASQAEVSTLYDVATHVYEPKVPETMPLAFALYLAAADRGHSESQLQVGFRYRRGLGVAVDEAQAIDWYLKAAAQDNVNALSDLGEFHEKGELVPQDMQKAFIFSLKAANKGDIFAAYRVGCMYQEGRGTTRDTVHAIRWLKKAAAFQLGDASARLQSLQRTGR